MKVYHFINHPDTSVFFKDRSGGGADAAIEYYTPVCKHFNAPVYLRDVFGTPSKEPMHLDGYLYASDWLRLEMLKFLDALTDFGRGAIHVGHAGGDLNPNRKTPYAPSPTLAHALTIGPSVFHSHYQQASYPYRKYEYDIVHDGSNHIDPDSPWFAELELWRIDNDRRGLKTYVESPPDLRPSSSGGAPHFETYAPCSTWNWFENAVNNNRWTYAQEGIVHVWSNPPEHIGQFEVVRVNNKRIFGKETAIEVARRLQLCDQYNCAAVLPLHFIMNMGYQNIDDFIGNYQ